MLNSGASWSTNRTNHDLPTRKDYMLRSTLSGNLSQFSDLSCSLGGAALAIRSGRTDPCDGSGRRTMTQITTAGRLLSQLYRESEEVRDAVATAAGILPERAD